MNERTNGSFSRLIIQTIDQSIDIIRTDTAPFIALLSPAPRSLSRLGHVSVGGHGAKYINRYVYDHKLSEAFHDLDITYEYLALG